MANYTQQFPISANNAAAQVIPADQNRRYMLIRNYSTSGQILWVAFGAIATCGNNGEIEILAGYTYEWGATRFISPNGLIANNQTFAQPNCPIEYVSVIAGTLGNPTGTAVGCLMVISP